MKHTLTTGNDKILAKAAADGRLQFRHAMVDLTDHLGHWPADELLSLQHAAANLSVAITEQLGSPRIRAELAEEITATLSDELDDCDEDEREGIVSAIDRIREHYPSN